MADFSHAKDRKDFFEANYLKNLFEFANAGNTELKKGWCYKTYMSPFIADKPRYLFILWKCPLVLLLHFYFQFYVKT